MIWCSLIIAGALWPLVGMSDTVRWTENDWLPLVDEPSRQELLQLTLPQDFEIEAFPRRFAFPQDTFQGKAPRKNAIFGVDISHHNGPNLPFEKLLAQNVRYVFVKATQGVAFKDPEFSHSWKTLNGLATDKRVLHGAYHFLSSSDDPIAQAERFVAYVTLHGGFKRDDLAPVVDLEWDIARANGPDRWMSRSPKEIVSATLSFMKRVEELTGKIPILYTARSWWRSRNISESEINKFARYPIWIADFSRLALDSEKPAVPNNAKPALWQFSDSATIAGKSGLIDVNIFRGTEEEFLRLILGNN